MPDWQLAGAPSGVVRKCSIAPSHYVRRRYGGGTEKAPLRYEGGLLLAWKEISDRAVGSQIFRRGNTYDRQQNMLPQRRYEGFHFVENVAPDKSA